MVNIIRVASVNTRDKKSGKGIVADFMIKEDDIDNEKYYPYMNLYYFKDKSDLHKHYIITIEGKLEIAHNTYRKGWTSHNDSIDFKTYGIDSIFLKKTFRHSITRAVLLKNIYFGNFMPFELYNQYAYLMNNAIKDYVVGNLMENIPFAVLINLLNNADSLNIPESDMNEEKNSIVKIRQKKLVMEDNYDEI